MKHTPLALVLLAAAVTACGLPSEPVRFDGGQPTATLGEGANNISVLTLNLYHGADIAAIARAPSSQVPFAAAAAWQKVQATDFPTRAAAIADEIVALRPDLIGLQEVTLWRTQTPSDFVLGQRSPNAETIAYDFLGILLDALADRGLTYQVAALSPTSDIEVPAYTGVGLIPYMDIRYRDADAVLVRSDVAVNETFAFQYVARGSGAMGRRNGWAAARVNVRDRDLTFVSTHLVGPDSRDLQLLQARELIAWVNQQPVPVILVGDFNSAANVGAAAESTTDTYPTLLAAGFSDVWVRGTKPTAGLTCCHDELLANAMPLFDARIDLILLNEGIDRMVGAAQASLFGADPSIRATYGLWPSDHAGVHAVLHLPMWR